MVAFEAGMPLMGVAIGAPLGHAIGDAADYVAIGVLAAFGLYTLVSDEDHEERSVALLDATGWRALALGVSIRLDKLAVGFTLGLLRLPVLIRGCCDRRPDPRGHPARDATRRAPRRARSRTCRATRRSRTDRARQRAARRKAHQLR